MNTGRVPKWIILILALLCGVPALGQSRQDSVRSRYIRRYPNHFFIWPVLKRRSLAFSVDNSKADVLPLQFKPNNSYSAGLGVYMFEIAAELSLNIPLDEKSTQKFGSSDSRDFSATLSGRHWGFDTYTQRYSGFYLSNPVAALPADGRFPVRPDVTLNNTGITGIYIFNKKRFSLWSAYSFSERQLTSRGSFLLAGTVNAFSLASDSLLLSDEYLQRLKTTTNFKDLRYQTFSVAPGYSYSVIYRHWYFNVALSIGPAHHWVYYQGADGKGHYDISINSFADARLAMGYNSDRWFGGLSFVNQTRTLRFEDIILESKSHSFRMLVGYRLEERGFLKKTWRDFFPPNWRRYL